jgi:hypothetical protein
MIDVYGLCTWFGDGFGIHVRGYGIFDVDYKKW